MRREEMPDGQHHKTSAEGSEKRKRYKRADRRPPRSIAERSRNRQDVNAMPCTRSFRSARALPPHPPASFFVLLTQPLFVPLSLLASSTFPLHPHRLMLQPHHGHVFFFSTHPTICSWTFVYYSKNDCCLKEIKNKHTHTSTNRILKDASKGNRHSLTRIIPLKPSSWIHPVT